MLEGGAVMIKYAVAFVVGGVLCVIAQILIDKTKLTPARILVIFVTTGAILRRTTEYTNI